MNSSHQIVIVVTTVASRADAEHLARQLIDTNLAACVQIEGPITSHYKWDGVVQSSTEFRITIKTGNACWQDLKRQLAVLHPYEQPEILMLPVTDTTEGYLKWAIQHTR
jgi:periplasmic divalent cation tolerance protein